MDNLLTILNRLKNPKILLATLANVLAVFAVMGFDAGNLEQYEKIGTIIIQILLQIGVLSNAE